MRSFFGDLRREWQNGSVPIRGALLALALFYAGLIVAFSPDQLKNDEPRYFRGAHFLTQGFFVKEGEPEFTNGPGYPLLLAPMMSVLGFEFEELIEDPRDYEFYVPDATGEAISSLKWRLLPLRLLNAIFLPLGLWCTFLAATQFVSRRAAFLIMLVIALNPFQLRWVAQLMTENVTPLFFSAFVLFYVRGLRTQKLNVTMVLLAGLAFASLVLTRTLFGYVATAALFLVPVVCLLFRRRDVMLKAVSPLAVCLVFCLPYLAYTHRHTERVFCWATNGGELLYWMTSPHDGEYGSWSQEKWIVKDQMLTEHHLDTVRRIKQLPVKERNEAWIEGARAHLQSERIVSALARNYVANVSRMFFNSPRTRTHETLPKMIWILTGFCFVLLAGAASIPTLFRWREVPVDLRLIIFLMMIYLGGVVMLPAGPRYLIPVMPGLLIWIGYAAERLFPAMLKAPLMKVVAHHRSIPVPPLEVAGSTSPSLPQRQSR